MKKIKRIRPLIILFVIIMLLITSVSGTIAWLKSKSNTLFDTFTYGDINIEITETKEDSNNYELYPGKEIKKDTIITVNALSEDCYVFIKIDETINLGDYITYSLVESWKQLEDFDNVYYREVSKSDSDQTFSIIKDNILKVKSDLTKVSLNALNENNYPKLTITGYAIQRNSDLEGINTPGDAWLLLSNQNN